MNNTVNYNGVELTAGIQALQVACVNSSINCNIVPTATSKAIAVMASSSLQAIKFYPGVGSTLSSLHTTLVGCVSANMKQLNLGVANLVSQRLKESINLMQTTYAEVIASSLAMLRESISANLGVTVEQRSQLLFIKILEELDFPSYLEVGTDLQDRLIESYFNNGHRCDKEEMNSIIFDYYNENMVSRIIQGMQNANVFNGRMHLINEGVELYRRGYFAGAGALFATQLSGMIADVYHDLLNYRHINKKEQFEIVKKYDGEYKPNSEKGMLVQMYEVEGLENFCWYKILKYFLYTMYSSKGERMLEDPMRHKICHGEQLNFDEKKMNLKLLICMDVISEMAWRASEFKEQQRIFDEK